MIYLSSLSQAAKSLQTYQESPESEGNVDKIQGPGPQVKFLGVIWLGKTEVMPEAVIDKIQAFSVLKE